MKRQIGSGVAAVVSAVDGKAAVVVSVSQDLKGSIDAVELVRTRVAELGGKGADGRPSFAKTAAPTAPAPTPRSRRSSARWQASRRRRSS